MDSLALEGSYSYSFQCTSYKGIVYSRQTNYSKSEYTLHIVPPAREGEFKSPFGCDINPKAFSQSRKISSIYLSALDRLTPGFGYYHNIEGFSTVSYHPLYSVKNGIVYSKSGKSIIQHPGKKADSFTVPSDVDSIKAKAFAGCEIGNLTVGETTKYIDYNAFDDFTGTITIHGSPNGNVFKQMAKTSALETCTIRVHGRYLSFVKQYWGGKAEPIEKYWVDNLTEYPVSCKFKVYAAEGLSLDKITKVTVNGKAVVANASGYYEATNLVPEKTYETCIYYLDESGTECVEKDRVSTDELFYEDCVPPEVSESTVKFGIGLRWEDIFMKDIMSGYEFGIMAKAKSFGDDEYHFFPATYNDGDDFGTVEIIGLYPSQELEYSVYMRIGEEIYCCRGGRYGYRDFSIYTESITPKFEYTATCTTITLKNVDTEYGTFKADRVEVSQDSSSASHSPKGFKMTGLRPCEFGKEENVSLYLKFYVGENEAYAKWIYLSTAKLKLATSAKVLGPTAFQATPTNGSSDEVDVQKFVLDFDGESYDCMPGKTVTVTGLAPEMSYLYSLKAVIKDAKGQYNYYFRERYYDSSSKKYLWRQDIPVRTEDIELTTLSPRNTSATTSVVCAETNIDDHESNVGFQWRKYDAPASLPSNEGYAAIYDGVMEGRIKNLQSTQYYNVRAFYKTSTGVYHYGDWVTFDPSDFSYFEPTVHTYAVEDITHDSANLRGYVMAGTDEIEQQGFEYSPLTAPGVVMRKTVVASPDAQSVVLSTGQVMMATLEGLTPSTTYTCRAFAKTSAGTVYGEEYQFTTEVLSGIFDISVDVERFILGYYDLMGNGHDKPVRGLNIVLYSDGTTEKLIIK